MCCYHFKHQRTVDILYTSCCSGSVAVRLSSVTFVFGGTSAEKCASNKDSDLALQLACSLTLEVIQQTAILH